jgi:RHS repeat-associated protein
VNGERAKLTPTYNRAGALKAVALQSRASSPIEAFVTQIAYNARGQRVLIAYGNGVMTRHAYDPNTFRLARLRSERFQQPDAQQWIGLGPATGLNDELLQDYSYRYDLAGNILSIEERVKHCGVRNPDPDQLLRQFEYDPLYRLTRATGRSAAQSSPAAPYEDRPMSGFHAAGNSSFSQANGPDLTEHYSEDYQYDPAGNMLAMGHSQGGSRWVRQYAHAATSNRLSSITVGSEIYTCEQDQNGNLIRQALNHHHDWDHADRMTGYRNQNGSAASVQARYVYGADGMRVKKWVKRGPSVLGEETTTYIGGLFEHHRWMENSTAMENNHLQVMDNQSRIAMVRVGPAHHQETAPPVQYHLGDHLGSSALVLGGADPRGAAFVNREEYSPYGENVFGSFGRKRYRFSGKESDMESGLSYFGARYYAPCMAKWISCDPFGHSAGLNIYRYTRNNPICRVDSWGLADAQVTGTAEPLSVKHFSLDNDHFLAQHLGGSKVDSKNIGFMNSYENQVVKQGAQWPGGKPPPLKTPVSLQSALASGPQSFQTAAADMVGGRRFAEVVELDILWKAALQSVGGNDYGRAQGAFRKLIGEGASPEAIIVRKAMATAGYGIIPNGKSFSFVLVEDLVPNASRAGYRAGILRKFGAAGGLALSLLQNTPAASGNDALTAYDPHFMDRLASEDDYFTKLAQGEAATPPFTPFNEPNAIYFLAQGVNWFVLGNLPEQGSDYNAYDKEWEAESFE